MTKEQANKLATISTRYSELHSASKDATRAITNVLDLIETEILQKGVNGYLISEKNETLSKARDFLHTIMNNTHSIDAVKYFMEIEKLQK